VAYCHPGHADAQFAGSCTRTANEKGGAGQPLTLAVSTAPELQAGTLAANGAAASGPAACWLAGLTSAPAAAAPSVPRLTTVPPASPNVYQSSGARQLFALLEGAAETVAVALALRVSEVAVALALVLGLRVHVALTLRVVLGKGEGVALALSAAGQLSAR
jgi:hypothetical protein